VSSVVDARPRALEGDSPLARCTGDADAFLRTTWGRRAAVLPRVDRLGYADLLTFDDVDRILSTTSLRTPSFRLVRSDRSIAESEYTRSGRTGSKPVDGMTDPARVFELFRQGATIVLQGLHRYWPPVTELCRGLELELGHPCQVNAYVTPPGAQGLALHEDPHDVFVLQAFGRKRWEVHAAPGESERQPVEATLEPGDCIYMPEGTPHAASTQETLSGHLTIGVHVASWRDVLADAWKRLERDPLLDDRVPAGWTRDPAGFASELARRLAQSGRQLGEVDVHEMTAGRIERFWSTRAPLLRGTLVEQLALDAIDDATPVRRRPGSVCELRTKGDRLVVLLGDRRLEMPGWLEPAMRRIADRGPFQVGDLRKEIEDEQSRVVLIRRLVREGLLGLEPVR
jgi:bifunctional lysine-specific demethylase and histidyl-hydroxylase NO66